jgi:molybdate transport system substrate-binding protein
VKNSTHRRRPARASRVVIAAAALVMLAGCSPATPPATSTPTNGEAATLSGQITVFAAASLTGTFTDLAAKFEEANPDATIALNFAGSSDLVTQITEGAPADVFASADIKNMTTLANAGLVSGDPVTFATNVLTIAVPPGNPAGIAEFADLAGADVTTVVCAPQVPCGAATEAVEAATGVTLTPVSEESSVTDVLGKVTSGEADAGLVYVTDVAAAGDAVEGIPFDESDEAVNTYPIAQVSESANAGLGAAFIEYVTGADGQAVLDAAGFGAP